jgi:hypothetical protein
MCNGYQEAQADLLALLAKGPDHPHGRLAVVLAWLGVDCELAVTSRDCGN